MIILKRKRDGVLILDMKGKILLGDGVDEFRGAINDAIQKKETRLILNLAEVPYLDVTGLDEVVRSYTTIRKEGGIVKIINLTEKVRDLLSVTKLITVFETFED